jgi:hypothetical protein
VLGISGFAQVFALVLGILAVTSEFRPARSRRACSSCDRVS